MKVAVVFSGLIRGPFNDHIKEWKRVTRCLKPDFFYTTWEDAGKYVLGVDKAKFVQKYFPDPDLTIKYYPIKFFIAEERARLETATEEEAVEIRQRIGDHFKNRKGSKRYVYQQLAHALTLDEFKIHENYDIIIRIRYDSHPLLTGRLLKKWCKKVHENEHIMYSSYDHHIDRQDKPSEPGFRANCKSIADQFMVHKNTHFPPELTYERIKNCELIGNERGWRQCCAVGDEFELYEVKWAIHLNRQTPEEFLTLP